jgi:ParB/RepB/Spo0J family partition protein
MTKKKVDPMSEAEADADRVVKEIQERHDAGEPVEAKDVETQPTKKQVQRTDSFAAEVAEALAPVENPHALEPLPKPASKIAYLPLKVLRESPTNPRKTYAKMEELTASVKSAGLLVPLIVRYVLGNTDSYEIVAGHRRYRAAKGAGLKEVPCDVRTLTDAQVTEIQITENLQRSDLTDLEEAETYESLRDQHHYSVDQIAAKIGVSKGTIYSRLKLMALCPEARKAMADGVLPSSVAVPLARLPSHRLQAAALKKLKDSFVYADSPVIGARGAIEYLQREFCRSLKGAPFSLSDAALVPEAGACAVCPKNTATATPGLFDDLKSLGKTCTDVGCFESKAKAAWQRTAERETAKGAEVLTPEEGAKLYQYGGHISYGSKYVALDEKNHADPKKRTWEELLETLPEAKRPKRVVVPDKDLVPHSVVDREALVAALAEKGLKWAEEETGRKEKRTGSSKEEREAKREEDLRRRVIGLGLEALAKKGPTKDSMEACWKLIARGMAQKWTNADVIDALGYENGGGEWSALRESLEEGKAKIQDAMLFVFATAIFEIDSELDALFEGGYPPSAEKLLKANGISLKEIEKAQRAAAEAEALMKPGKKEKAS